MKVHSCSVCGEPEATLRDVRIVNSQTGGNFPYCPHCGQVPRQRMPVEPSPLPAGFVDNDHDGMS